LPDAVQIGRKKEFEWTGVRIRYLVAIQGATSLKRGWEEWALGSRKRTQRVFWAITAPILSSLRRIVATWARIISVPSQAQSAEGLDPHLVHRPGRVALGPVFQAALYRRADRHIIAIHSGFRGGIVAKTASSFKSSSPTATL
jgi:hypothetical protein